MDFNTDTTTRYLYHFPFNGNASYTIIGGCNPTNCTGLQLEETVNLFVKDKKLTLRGSTANFGVAGTATFRLFTRGYRRTTE